MATGARIGPSELFRLRWSDVDVGTGVIRMPNAHKGAGEESRDVPIRDDVLGLLRRWHEEDRQTGCAYVIAYKGRPVRSISSGWHNALRRAGIARRIRPYDLRHAFASLALVYGADIKCVAETMGHKNITMLLSVYQHTHFEQRRQAVNAAPGLFSGTGAKRGKKKRLPPGRGKEASAFFEPDPERRAAPPHDAAASWGVAACVCAGTRAADRTDAGTPDARQPDGSGAG